MQVVELDGMNAKEYNVQVKWLFGAEATSERITLLRRATPYMLDFARQMCGAEVGVSPVIWCVCVDCVSGRSCYSTPVLYRVTCSLVMHLQPFVTGWFDA